METFREPFELRQSPDLSWRADEIVRQLDDRPHLLTRIEISGGAFPHMGAEPFVRVIRKGDMARSWFADVADDSTTLSGYFPVDLAPGEGVVEYGYGNRVFGRMGGRFDPRKIDRLDRDRLPRGLVVVTTEFIRRKESGNRPPKIRMPEPKNRQGRSAG